VAVKAKPCGRYAALTGLARVGLLGEQAGVVQRIGARRPNPETEVRKNAVTASHGTSCRVVTQNLKEENRIWDARV